MIRPDRPARIVLALLFVVCSAAASSSIPHVTMTISAPEQLDANNDGMLTFTVSNPADLRAEEIFTDIALNRAGTAVSVTAAPGWSCVHAAYGSPGTLHCTTPGIEAHASTTIAITARYSQHYLLETVLVNLGQAPNGLFESVAQDVAFAKPFQVTSTADSGPGSLREVVSEINAECTRFDVFTPCSITFNLPPPVPAQGWYTIEPLSPLPVFTADHVTIDGETQTAATGDTNPLGPEVFLLGDRAGVCDGVGTPGFLEVRGLAIGGFAQNGVMLALGSIERDYIGTDPTGSHAVPNGLHGISTSPSTRGAITITGNVISGNGRNGINFDTFTDPFTIANNRIGLAAKSDDRVPNGSSGIQITNMGGLYRGGQIEGNVIKFNGGFGIGIDRNSTGVRILENIVAHNHNQAIDIGMDGASSFSLSPPVIESATFDPASGQTVVTGKGALTGVVSGYDYSATLYFYANSAPVSEGERFIGSVATDSTGRFVHRVNGDLRGLWITGTTDQVIDFHDFVARNASEFSAPHQATATGPARRRIVKR
ncbi:MAG TPA: right-handed parallel beta-helix repeat-containing protein [Thermoanaerobaculia bacterium]|nr:right-handed parallel beta-helix repeat-containing protein [Thermoanaerobaculia bacterium]